MEILHKLGIDWTLLVAQGVNFLILLYILKRFVYKPMLAFLDERSEKIEAGLKNAEAAGEKLKAAEVEHAEVLKKAQEEARAVVQSASEAAKKRDAEMLLRAENEVTKMMVSAKESIESEKKKMLSEAKEELSALVLRATEKVTKETLGSSDDQARIRQALNEK